MVDEGTEGGETVDETEERGGAEVEALRRGEVLGQATCELYNRVEGDGDKCPEDVWP